MLKLLYKTISVVLTTAVIYISCCSASDSGVLTGQEPSYIPPPPKIETPKTLVIKKPLEEKPPGEDSLKPPQVQPKQETTEKPVIEPEKQIEPEQEPPEVSEEPQAQFQAVEQPESPQQPEQQTQPQQPQPPIEPPVKSEGIIGKILVALLKSVAIILAAIGFYKIYPKLVAMMKKMSAKKSAPSGGDAEEPKTIGEAVSSYIKHKLRK